MRARPTRPCRDAISLIESIVVIAIIAILIGLLFPALLSSRERARQATCASHLNQLHLAMSQFGDTHRRLPDVCPPNAIGGWVIEILPFLEERQLAYALSGHPPLDTPAGALPLDRLPIMTCPSAIGETGPADRVPRSHYTAILGRHRKLDHVFWEIGDLPTDSNVPWVASPELAPGGQAAVAPHRGGYNIISGSIGGSTTHWLRWHPGT